MKMLAGFLFSIGIVVYSIIKKEKYWEFTASVATIGALIFLGQFVGR